MDDTPTLSELLPAYRRHLDSLCYADTTIRRYAYEAECFCEFSWRHGRIWPATIRAPDLEAWQQALADSEQRVPSTIVTRMRGLRAFFSYLAETGLVKRDPFVGFPMPRLPSVLPRDVLTITEVLNLLRPQSGEATEARDLLAIELLYATGLRVSELCDLDVADLDLSRRLVRVRLGKGAKDRVVPMGRGTADKLKALVSLRDPQGHPPARPLFLSARGRRLTPSAVEAMLRREAHRRSITKRVTPHTLRHTCATHMHARGAGIFHIRDILGHADVTTTQIYTRVAPREAQRTHREKHPRERAARRLRLRGCRPERSALTIASVALPPAPSASAGRRPTPGRSPAPCGYGSIPGEGPIDKATRRWVAAYAGHLRLLNRSERTVRAHVARLRSFLDFAVSRGVMSCLAVDRQLIVDYRAQLAERLSGAAVRNQFLAVVLCFYRFLAYREALPENPGSGVRYAREPLVLPRRVPSPSEMARIIEQPDIDTPGGLRDRTILEVLYSCGLRKEELIALTLDAVNLDEGRLGVWAGKGEKDRVVPIGTTAAHFVRQYVELARPRLAGPESPPALLFLSMRGRRLSKNSLADIVRKHATAAGLGASGLTPHAVRHAFATHLIQNGASLRHVQDMLGHASIASTQVYVHLTIPDLRRVHRKTHPLG